MAGHLRRCFALAFAACALAGCAGSSERPAASVGGVEISNRQLETDVEAFTFLSGLSGATCGTPIEGETQDAACARLALSNEIQEEIVKAYALANDLAVTDEVVRDAVSQVELTLGGSEALDEQLSQAGMTREEFRALARRLLLVGVVRDAVVDERLGEDALQGLYEGLLPQFTTVEVAHILLPTREEAEDVAALATPENFAKLARTRSTDQGSAANGGSLGAFSEAQFRQQFDPTFVEAALALEAGTISGVVETDFGFHVIRLVSEDVATFEQVRDQLVAQQAPQVFSAWLDERYDETEIEVNPRYGRLDDTRQVVPVRSTENTPVPTDVSGPTGVSAP
jgi:foldase protein PrsA